MNRTGTRVSYDIIAEFMIRSNGLPNDMAQCISDVKHRGGIWEGLYKINLPMEIDVPTNDPVAAVDGVKRHWRGPKGEFLYLLAFNCLVGMYFDYDEVVYIIPTGDFEIKKGSIRTSGIYDYE